MPIIPDRIREKINFILLILNKLLKERKGDPDFLNWRNEDLGNYSTYVFK